MKNAIFVLLVLITYNVTAQDSTFTISKVVKVDSVLKEALYTRAKLWIATSYNSAQNVIQLDDKENNTIVVKALFSVTASAGLMSRQEEGLVKYTLTIQCKDGRYKYTLEDFIHECTVGYGSGGNLNNKKPDCGNFSLPKAGWEDIKSQAVSYANHLELSIEEGMNNSPKTSKSNDW